jgi:taurine dioxygenase
MTITIHPFDAALGAEIRGVDLSKILNDTDFTEIERAYNEHSVLLFRDQDISPEQHVAFSRRFGDLEIHVLDQYLHHEHKEILIVSNVEDGGRNIGVPDAGRYWHTDLSYAAEPSRGSLLYAIEIPYDVKGKPLGETQFASTAVAYDALLDEMKARIENLEAEFSLAHRFKKINEDFDPDAELNETQEEQVPSVTHKVVRTHPITGRKNIYVNEGHTVSIKGLPAAEAKTLLLELWSHIKRPEFVYIHLWRKGDLLMWDNIPCQHIAIGDYVLPQRCYMHRTTLKGEAPI